MTQPQASMNGPTPKPPRAKWLPGLLRTLLRCVPRGHRTLMRWYARVVGQGDHFFGRFDDQWWRVDVDDVFLSASIFRRGFGEPSATQVFLALMPSQGVVIDVGANKGYYSLLAAKRLGPGSRVISLEPFPANIAILEQNICMNGYENVTVVKAAAWSRSGSVSFASPESSENPGTGQVSDRGTFQVEAVTIDGLSGELGLDSVDVLKMDIEGGEVEAVRGAANMLKRQAIASLIIETHTSILDPADVLRLFSMLCGFGYECYLVAAERDLEALRALRRGDRLDPFMVPYDPRKGWTEPWQPKMVWLRPGAHPAPRAAL